MNFFRYIISFIFPLKTETRSSAVSGKLEVNYSQGRYVLDSENVNYSFGGLHTVLRQAFDRMKVKERKLSNALVLGFGTGSVAGILQEEYGMSVSITGVEKDEEVIALGKKYFSTDKHKGLELIQGDAYDFVLQQSPRPFDLVLVDVFVDLKVPERFREEEFLKKLKSFLSPDGILFFNFIARDEKTRGAGGRLYKLLTEVFGKTEWVRLFARSTENWVFVCGQLDE